MAERFSGASILAMSNSQSQREYIQRQARKRQLGNVEVVTCDINEFLPQGPFDRIVSVEMLEHVRNHRALFGRIARWLTPEGKFFFHVFCHRRFAYPFEAVDVDDWMGRYFFTGGMMPAFDYFLHVQDFLALEKRWMVNGRHYAQTAGAWLENLDRRKEEILPTLACVYGHGEEMRWFTRWRLFFMACQELFSFANGCEWFVGHYRFRR